jgi:hypothetical protein
MFTKLTLVAAITLSTVAAAGNAASARTIVRDHRTLPIVRDHRPAAPPAAAPIVRDHRDSAVAPIVRDHRL